MARMPPLPPLAYGSGHPPESLTLAAANRDFLAFRDKLPEWRETILSELQKGGVEWRGDSARFFNAAEGWLNERVRYVRDPLPDDRHHKDLDGLSDLACRYVGLLFGDRLVVDCSEASWRVGPSGKRDNMRHAPVVGVDWRLVFWPGIVANFFCARENYQADLGPRAESLGELYERWRANFTPDLSDELRTVLSPHRDRTDPVPPEVARRAVEDIDSLLRRGSLPVLELIHAANKRFENDRRWRRTLLDLKTELAHAVPPGA